MDIMVPTALSLPAESKKSDTIQTVYSVTITPYANVKIFCLWTWTTHANVNTPTDAIVNTN